MITPITINNNISYQGSKHSLQRNELSKIHKGKSQKLQEKEEKSHPHSKQVMTAYGLLAAAIMSYGTATTIQKGNTVNITPKTSISQTQETKEEAIENAPIKENKEKNNKPKAHKEETTTETQTTTQEATKAETTTQAPTTTEAQTTTKEEPAVSFYTQIDSQLKEALDSRLGAGFSAKVEQVAYNINCDPNDLLGMMYSESALNPRAYNKSGASGLIQIMENTANSVLHTTGYAIRNTSAIGQLDYVEKYFQYSKKVAGMSENAKLDAGTLYALCFLPAQARYEELCNDKNLYTWAYYGNPGLDVKDGRGRSDGKITRSDLCQKVKGKYWEMYNNFM